MSKAYVIKTKRLKKKAKKVVKSKDPLLRFFGATDAFLDYSKYYGEFSFSPIGDGFDASLNIPLVPELPLETPAFKNFFGVISSDAYLLPENVEAPVLLPEPEHIGRIDRVDSKADLKHLLALLDDSGLKVDEVKALPSGATRITVEEFLSMNRAKEPEFIRVRS